jgi:hypothetical protein
VRAQRGRGVRELREEGEISVVDDDIPRIWRGGTSPQVIPQPLLQSTSNAGVTSGLQYRRFHETSEHGLLLASTFDLDLMMYRLPTNS